MRFSIFFFFFFIAYPGCVRVRVSEVRIKRYVKNFAKLRSVASSPRRVSVNGDCSLVKIFNVLHYNFVIKFALNVLMLRSKK